MKSWASINGENCSLSQVPGAKGYQKLTGVSQFCAYRINGYSENALVQASALEMKLKASSQLSSPLREAWPLSLSTLARCKTEQQVLAPFKVYFSYFISRDGNSWPIEIGIPRAKHQD